MRRCCCATVRRGSGAPTKSKSGHRRATENLTLNRRANSFVRPWIEREGMKSHPAPKEAESVIQ